MIAVAVAGLVLGAGCGSSSGKSSSAGVTPAPNATSAPPATIDAAGDDGSSTAAEIPDIPDATWSNGRAHVEVSGDKASNFESDGSGATTNGFTSAAFPLNTGQTMSVALGGEEGSAISLTADGVSTTGAFGKDCDITFSKHDAEGVTADFTCTSLPAVGSSSTQVYTINVKGNFTLTP
jgi:hypothetical protein